jgi:hypothetical protein
MPVVQETVLDPAGRPAREVQIDLLLVASEDASGNAPGYGSSATAILGRWRTWTDADGAWSADLLANSAITPANTYYTLHRKGRGVVSDEALVVPNGPGPYGVNEVLTVAPTALPFFLSDAVALALADTAQAGTGGKAARADHVHPTTGLSTDAALLGHAADTTGVHGILDTGVLETQSGAQAKVDAALADTTGVHGIADTSLLETQASVVTHHLNEFAVPAADLSAGDQRVIHVAPPTADTDAATKAYVDAAGSGLTWKNAARAATTVAGTLASSFENGDVIDGVTLATGDRILVKNQAAGAENGIYVVAASGAPTRATDADTGAELVAGTAVLVTAGTANAGSTWRQATTGTITVGVTAITWQQFGAATSYTAGAGLTLGGNAFALDAPVTVARGGTGAATAPAALTALGAASASDLAALIAATDPLPVYLLKTLLDAKGDLLVASAADTPMRLGLGSDGQVLIVDSATASGLKYGSVPLIAPVTTSTDLSVLPGHETIFVNETSQRNITLPSPASIPFGKLYRVIKGDQNLLAVRIVSQAGELINGQAMIALRQYRETVQVMSDGTNWHVLNRYMSGIANAHDFGARGDNIVDEQPAIQATIDFAAINKMICYVPPGVYRLYSALDFKSLGGFSFICGGGQGQSSLEHESSGNGWVAGAMGTNSLAYDVVSTIFAWYGNQTTPMFRMGDCRNCWWEGFQINGNTAGALYVGLEIYSLASVDGSANPVPRGAVTTPSRNVFRKISINGINGTGTIYGIRFPHPTNSLNAPANAADANNDYCLFDMCEVQNCVIAVSEDASQQKSHTFRNFFAVGVGTTMLAIFAIGCPISNTTYTPAGVTFNTGAVGGSFYWTGGGGGHSQLADVIVGNIGNDTYELANLDIESSVRLLAMQPISAQGATQASFTIRNCRWSHAGQIHADKKWIIWGWSGTLSVLGNSIQDSSPGNALQVSIKVPASGALRLRLDNNTIDSTATDLVTIDVPSVDRFQYSQVGNVGVNKATSAVVKWPDYDFASMALRIAGGATKTANYTMTPQDELVIAGDTGAAGITITLPDATLMKGVTKRIIRKSASFTTTIAATSSQTINGAAASTFNLTAAFQVLVVISDGANWLKLN